MADETSYHLYFQKDSPHQNVFKLTLSQKSFYVFRKDRQCKFVFLLSPKFRPDKHHLCTGSWSNESSQQNLAEKPAYFTGCWFLSTTLPSGHMITCFLTMFSQDGLSLVRLFFTKHRPCHNLHPNFSNLAQQNSVKKYKSSMSSL